MSRSSGSITRGRQGCRKRAVCATEPRWKPMAKDQAAAGSGRAPCWSYAINIASKKQQATEKLVAPRASAPKACPESRLKWRQASSSTGKLD